MLGSPCCRWHTRGYPGRGSTREGAAAVRRCPRKQGDQTNGSQAGKFCPAYLIVDPLAFVLAAVVVRVRAVAVTLAVHPGALFHTNTGSASQLRTSLPPRRCKRKRAITSPARTHLEHIVVRVLQPPLAVHLPILNRAGIHRGRSLRLRNMALTDTSGDVESQRRRDEPFKRSFVAFVTL